MGVGKIFSHNCSHRTQNSGRTVNVLVNFAMFLLGNDFGTLEAYLCRWESEEIIKVDLRKS